MVSVIVNLLPLFFLVFSHSAKTDRTYDHMATEGKSQGPFSFLEKQTHEYIIKRACISISIEITITNVQNKVTFAI